MNILFYFIHQINPLKGGTERVADNVAHGLRARGHNIYYMSTTHVEGEYDIPCFFLPDVEGVTPRNIEYVNQFCREHQIDVIINEAGNTNEVRLFSKEHIHGVRIITELHFCPSQSLRYFFRSHQSPFPLQGKESLVKLCRLIKAPYNKWRLSCLFARNYKYMYDNSDKVVVLSPSYIQEFAYIAGLTDTSHLCAILNPNTFASPEASPQKEKVVLSIGRLDFSPKKIHYLLDIWKRVYPSHPDWILEICGDGPARPSLERKVERECISGVIFRGNVSPQPYYERTSIMCMTSIYEGTPMVIVEAMQCNCVPVVYDTYSAAKDMIEDGKTGFIIPPFNKKEYADKLSLLMDNENLRQQMGEAAKASTERFEIEGIIDQWESLIKGLRG